MIVSGHVRETTCKKAMAVMVLLKTMHKRNEDKAHFQCGGKAACVIAKEVASTLGISKTFLYRSYKEWRQGEATRWATVIDANSGTVPLGFGSFVRDAIFYWRRKISR